MKQCVTGIYTEEDLRMMDYAWRSDPTWSQRRIERYMEEHEEVEGSAILHVGIGNSSVASKFRTAKRIDGLTIVDSEYDRSKALGLPNYQTFMIDKYSSDILELDGGYDFIIDNNLSSYAPDFQSFLDLLGSYKRLLSYSGKIISERSGLMYFYKTSKCPRLCVWMLKVVASDFRVKVKNRDVIVLTHRGPDGHRPYGCESFLNTALRKGVIWLLRRTTVLRILNNRYAKVVLMPGIYIRRILWNLKLVRLARNYGLIGRKVMDSSGDRKYTEFVCKTNKQCVAQIHKDRGRTDGLVLVIGDPDGSCPCSSNLEEISKEEFDRLEGDFGWNREWLRGYGAFDNQEHAKGFWLPHDLVDEVDGGTMLRDVDALLSYAAERGYLCSHS